MSTQTPASGKAIEHWDTLQVTPLIRDFNLTWMVGAPIEDTISTIQLITRGIPSRFPHMRIINSHLGGALPMLLQPADDQYKWEYPQPSEPPSTAAGRMWYDTVGPIARTLRNTTERRCAHHQNGDPHV